MMQALLQNAQPTPMRTKSYRFAAQYCSTKSIYSTSDIDLHEVLDACACALGRLFSKASNTELQTGEQRSMVTSLVELPCLVISMTDCCAPAIMRGTNMITEGSPPTLWPSSRDNEIGMKLALACLKEENRRLKEIVVSLSETILRNIAQAHT